MLTLKQRWITVLYNKKENSFTTNGFITEEEYESKTFNTNVEQTEPIFSFSNKFNVQSLSTKIKDNDGKVYKQSRWVILNETIGETTNLDTINRRYGNSLDNEPNPFNERIVNNNYSLMDIKEVLTLIYKNSNYNVDIAGDLTICYVLLYELDEYDTSAGGESDGGESGESQQPGDNNVDNIADIKLSYDVVLLNHNIEYNISDDKKSITKTTESNYYLDIDNYNRQRQDNKLQIPSETLEIQRGITLYLPTFENKINYKGKEYLGLSHGGIDYIFGGVYVNGNVINFDYNFQYEYLSDGETIKLNQNNIPYYKKDSNGNPDYIINSEEKTLINEIHRSHIKYIKDNYNDSYVVDYRFDELKLEKPGKFFVGNKLIINELLEYFEQINNDISIVKLINENGRNFLTLKISFILIPFKDYWSDIYIYNNHKSTDKEHLQNYKLKFVWGYTDSINNLNVNGDNKIIDNNGNVLDIEENIVQTFNKPIILFDHPEIAGATFKKWILLKYTDNENKWEQYDFDEDTVINISNYKYYSSENTFIFATYDLWDNGKYTPLDHTAVDIEVQHFVNGIPANVSYCYPKYPNGFEFDYDDLFETNQIYNGFLIKENYTKQKSYYVNRYNYQIDGFVDKQSQNNKLKLAYKLNERDNKLIIRQNYSSTSDYKSLHNVISSNYNTNKINIYLHIKLEDQDGFYVNDIISDIKLGDNIFSQFNSRNILYKDLFFFINENNDSGDFQEKFEKILNDYSNLLVFSNNDENPNTSDYKYIYDSKSEQLYELFDITNLENSIFVVNTNKFDVEDIIKNLQDEEINNNLNNIQDSSKLLQSSVSKFKYTSPIRTFTGAKKYPDSLKLNRYSDIKSFCNKFFYGKLTFDMLFKILPLDICVNDIIKYTSPADNGVINEEELLIPSLHFVIYYKKSNLSEEDYVKYINNKYSIYQSIISNNGAIINNDDYPTPATWEKQKSDDTNENNSESSTKMPVIGEEENPEDTVENNENIPTEPPTLETNQYNASVSNSLNSMADAFKDGSLSIEFRKPVTEFFNKNIFILNMAKELICAQNLDQIKDIQKQIKKCFVTAEQFWSESKKYRDDITEK